MRTRNAVLLLAGLAVVSILFACSSGGGRAFHIRSYDFAQAHPSSYRQVDRTGTPLTATLFLPAELRDAYNQSSPVEDTRGVFAEHIVARARSLIDDLGGDLVTLGVVPCDLERSLDQLAPVIFPDVLRFDPELPAGFPNGRKLDDTAADIMLALTFLDLDAPYQTIHTFALRRLLNHDKNDVGLFDTFPHLHRPHD